MRMSHEKKDKEKDLLITESYEIEVEDWDVYYHFGMNIAPKDLIEGVYWETSKLMLTGKLISPVSRASKARIEMAGEHRMDDHWQQKPTIISAKAMGWIELPRGNERLIFYCSVPDRSIAIHNLGHPVGRIKCVSIFGTKLKWRRGTISSLSLSTRSDDE